MPAEAEGAVGGEASARFHKERIALVACAAEHRCDPDRREAWKKSKKLTNQFLEKEKASFLQ